LRRIADEFLDFASAAARDYFEWPDIEPHVWIETGSVKVRTRLLRAGKAVIWFLAAVDGVTEGVDN
jgi:hypothetical protein